MGCIPLEVRLSHWKCANRWSRVHSLANSTWWRRPIRSTITGMSTSLAAVAAAQGGYFTTGQARDCGHDTRAIRDAVRSGEWRHLRRGAYALADTYDSLSEPDRHVVLTRAVVAKIGPDRVAVTHQSASCVHSHDQWGWDTSVVNVTRLDGGAARQEAGVRHHVGEIREDDLVEHPGMLVVREDRAVVEACTQMPVEAGLCIVDSALRLARVDHEMLLAYGDRFEAWPESRHARLALRLGNGKAATVGETRSRYLFWRFGLPVPELQVEVRGRHGQLLAIVDFFWELYRHVGEFDGRRKYTRDIKPNEDVGEVVFREKRREDAVRAEDLGMSRLIWAQLDPPVNRMTAERFASDLRRSRRLYARNRVVIA
jgi:hypothetical protein